MSPAGEPLLSALIHVYLAERPPRRVIARKCRRYTRTACYSSRGKTLPGAFSLSRLRCVKIRRRRIVDAGCETQNYELFVESLIGLAIVTRNNHLSVRLYLTKTLSKMMARKLLLYAFSHRHPEITGQSFLAYYI